MKFVKNAKNSGYDEDKSGDIEWIESVAKVNLLGKMVNQVSICTNEF